MTDPTDFMMRASQARKAGKFDEAARLLQLALNATPDDPRLLNSLGLVLLDRGDGSGAAAQFRCAADADPAEPLLRINLANAHRMMGDPQGELAALDAALALDPLLMPALLRKAMLLDSLGRRGDATRIFRDLLRSCPDDSQLPAPTAAALKHGRALVEEDDRQRTHVIAPHAGAVRARFPHADLRRAEAYVAAMTGQRRVYTCQPTGALFPYLPAIEFFDREYFAWFDLLESATGDITRELHEIWSDPGDELVPYVAYSQGTPVNQWEALNHSPNWSAFFLLKDGVPQHRNLARCPATARLLEQLPLLDIAGRGPTAMFSILAPQTRIPPHTGSTNIRTTVHLPLVVPEGCSFRVGSETRQWRVGEAWAFDDTIEHEAWNGSDRPRAILILDAWNPLLSDAEKALVRDATAAIA